MVRPKTKVSKVRMVGPLVPFTDEFTSTLKSSGYTPLTIVNELRLMAHLSRWMTARSFAVADLSPEMLLQYEASVRASGRTFMSSNGSLVPLRRFLGIAASSPAPIPASPTTELLASFRRHLLNERGLATCTTTAYLLRASRFLSWTAADGNVSVLTTGYVTQAVLRESQSVSVGSAQFFVAAVRSFLRFCFVEGLITVDLAPAALAVTGRRRSTLPRGISSKDAGALLRACDRRQSTGRRDFAVIMTLLRLGLRAEEAARLMLDDIDWRGAQIVIHGKGNRDARRSNTVTGSSTCVSRHPTQRARRGRSVSAMPCTSRARAHPHGRSDCSHLGHAS